MKQYSSGFYLTTYRIRSKFLPLNCSILFLTRYMCHRAYFLLTVIVDFNSSLKAYSSSMLRYHSTKIFREWTLRYDMLLNGGRLVLKLF